MEINLNNLKELCRVCATVNEAENRRYLYIQKDQLSELGKKFELCLGIEVRIILFYFLNEFQ